LLFNHEAYRINCFKLPSENEESKEEHGGASAVSSTSGQEVTIRNASRSPAARQAQFRIPKKKQ
jgi:hypothetical protein